jgi:hypothetical protein
MTTYDREDWTHAQRIAWEAIERARRVVYNWTGPIWASSVALRTSEATEAYRRGDYALATSLAGAVSAIRLLDRCRDSAVLVIEGARQHDCMGFDVEAMERCDADWPGAPDGWAVGVLGACIGADVCTDRFPRI